LGTSKKYRFYLNNASLGLLELKIAPDGWIKNEVEYVRSETYHGVSRSISVKELTFFKDGRDYLQSAYENQGIDCLVSFTVNMLDKATQTYLEYHVSEIDFGTYDISETGVKVGIVDNSFNEKIYNRDSVEVDLLNLTSIDGVAITDFDRKYVKMPDTSINREGILIEDTGGFITTSPHILPVAVSGTPDFSEMQAQPAGGGITTASNSFFYQNQIDRIINVSGNIQATFTDLNVHYLGIIVRIFEEDGVSYTDYGLFSPMPDSPAGSFSITINHNFTLLEGQSAMLIGEIDPTTGLSHFNYDSIDLAISETYEGTPEINVFGFPYYEAFLRCCQILTGETNPFYSLFFGRNDTPLNVYDTEGVPGFVIRGRFFRVPYDFTRRTTIPVKLVDLFQSLSSIYNLGMSIIDLEVGGVTTKKVRIEEREYFYNENVIIDISDRIRTQDIGKAVSPDMFYNEIQVGYNSFEYEQTGGLFEYNVKSIFTTEIKRIKNVLNIVSPYRADNQGIRLILKAPQAVDSDGVSTYDISEDVKGDDDIFLVDAVKSGSTYTARTSQGFSSIDGTIYADLSFNLLLSPARMIRRWGNVIKAGLVKALGTSVRWQTSDKNTLLSTQLTTETSPVAENADILANKLNQNIWFNEIYTAKAPITIAEKVRLDANMNGIVKLDSDKYGWIKSLKTNNEDGMAEFELIKVNLDAVTPIELS